MQSSTILKNKYAAGISHIKRKHRLGTTPWVPDNEHEEIYQFSFQTLYADSKAFFENPIAKEDQAGYEEHFRTVITEGFVPPEVMVCAAAFSFVRQENKDHPPEKVCEQWDTNLDKALQFAAIGFLTVHPLRDGEYLETFFCLYRALLQLSANPNFETDQFAPHIRYAEKRGHTWIVPITELKSTMALAASLTTQTDRSRQLLIDCAKQLKKLMLPLRTGPEKIEHVLTSLIRRDGVLVKLPWFQLFEETFKDSLQFFFMLVPSRRLIEKLGQHADFASTEYLEKEYKVDTFSVLADCDSKEVEWIKTRIFQYISEKFPERLQKFIRDHHDRIIQRFELEKLAKESHFGVIDEYRAAYPIDVFPTLWKMQMESKHVPWCGTRLFSYLETCFPERVCKELETNCEALVRKFLERDYSLEVSKYNDLQSFKRIMKYSFFRVAQLVVRMQADYPDFFDDFIIKLLERFNPLGFKTILLSEIKTGVINFCERPLDMKHAAYAYDIDPFRFKKEDKSLRGELIWSRLSGWDRGSDGRATDRLKEFNDALKDFWSQRARFVLNTIAQQKYPNAVKSEKSFFWNGRGSPVSADLYSLIARLRQIAHMSFMINVATEYENMFVLAKTLANQKPPNRNLAEQQIYDGLLNDFSDDSCVSRHVRAQFECAVTDKVSKQYVSFLLPFLNQKFHEEEVKKQLATDSEWRKQLVTKYVAETKQPKLLGDYLKKADQDPAFRNQLIQKYTRTTKNRKDAETDAKRAAKDKALIPVSPLYAFKHDPLCDKNIVKIMFSFLGHGNAQDGSESTESDIVADKAGTHPKPAYAGPGPESGN